MVKTINNGYEPFELDLPKKGWNCRSHVANLEYCIDQLSERQSIQDQKLVIGYYLGRGPGIKQMFHEIISEDEVIIRQGGRIKYQYLTLDDLLQRKKEIEEGIFEIKDGSILGFTEKYRRKMGWIK